MTAADIDLLADKLGDPLWRLTSGELYRISPSDGSGIQPFMPRPEQVKVIEALLSGKKILIPKARRLGMSTTLGIYAADCLVWKRGWQGSLVDQNAADASRKLDRIVKLAIENLPEWLLPRLTLPKANDSVLSVDLAGTGASSMYAGMNARGGSNDFLWVSEWGVIQHEDPKRSAKIRSGALPSARHGITAIETTWAGGRQGDVWELLEPILTGMADDWEVLFFPWWIDPRNVSENAVIDDAARQYFHKIAPRLQADGITISERQMRWWAQERRAQGVWMARENPTFLDECWTVPVEGSIYAEVMNQAKAEGRVASFPVDGSNLVWTSWDLGSPQNMVVWYFQIVGREIRIIDCDRNFEGTLTERVAYMLGRGFNYGGHFLPHDAMQTERTGVTVLAELSRIGLTGLKVVPRTHSVWVGINHLLEMFNVLHFRTPACDDGIMALENYRTRRIAEGGNTDEPIHDWASHTADALRVMAEAHRAGMIKFSWTEAQPRPGYYGKPRRGMKAIRVSA